MIVQRMAVLFVLALTLLSRGRAEDLSSYPGAGLYGRFCASCHGARGLGDGPVAGALRGMVPDLTRLAKRHNGAFPADQVRRIIDGREVRSPHGAREMPVWGFEFRAAAGGDPKAEKQADEFIDRLVEYLRSLQR